jgi:hypothetical protein
VKKQSRVKVKPVTFPETSDLYGNVQKNNHIAWKNIDVYDLLSGAHGSAYAMIATAVNRS